MSTKPIGLALGSGAARGWAHIGVLRGLHDAGIEVAHVAGTSMGALVGGAFAADSLDEIEQIAVGLDWKDFLYYFSDLSFTRSGLVDGRKVTTFLRKHFKAPRIEDMRIPFRAVATDVLTGEEIEFTEGDVVDAIRASISIPGLFTPIAMEFDGTQRTLVDGGLVNPVPVSVARRMGDTPVVAVEINHEMARTRSSMRAERLRKQETRILESSIVKAFERTIRNFDLKAVAAQALWRSRRSRPGVVDVLGNTVRIMEERIGAATLRECPPDVLIRPAVGHIDYMEFHRVSEAIDAGREAVTAALPEIRNALS